MYDIRKYTITILLILYSHVSGFASNDTIRLYFNLDQAQLTKRSEATLDSLIYYDKINSAQNLLILGYADYLGSTDYNEKLSSNRAETVKGYLAQMGITNATIQLMAKGEVDRSKSDNEGYPTDRRVDIIFDAKNQSIFIPAKAIAPKVIPAKPVVENNLPDQPNSFNIITTADVGQTFVMDKIYFHAGRHVITDESIPELLNLVRVMKRNPKLKIRIEGHVCCVPLNKDALDEETFEMALSVNRAKYIYHFLLDKGINRGRLSFAGYGRSKPLVIIERSLEDEAKNRRVEIRVLEK